jgi:hypothetical protein
MGHAVSNGTNSRHHPFCCLDSGPDGPGEFDVLHPCSCRRRSNFDRTWNDEYINVMVDFAVCPNSNFREIISLSRVPFLGEEVSVVAKEIVTPWHCRVNG